MTFIKQNQSIEKAMPSLVYVLLALLVLGCSYKFVQPTKQGPRIEIELEYRRPLLEQYAGTLSLAPVQRVQIVDAGRDLLVGNENAIQRIDFESGKTRAALPVSGVVAGCLAARGNAVFACTDEGFVYGWTAQNTASTWSRLLDEPLGVAATIHNGCLLVAARSGSVWCLDPDTGADRWKLGVIQVQNDKVSPVVRLIPTKQNEMLVWRAAGELSWIRFDSNEYVVVKSYYAADQDFLVDSDPIVYADRVVLPSSSEKSLLAFFDHTRTVVELPGGLRSAELWEQNHHESTKSQVPLSDNGGVLRVQSDGGYALEAAQFRDHVRAVIQWNRGSAIERVLPENGRLDYTHSGEFLYNGSTILDSHLGSVGSNVVLRQGVKLSTVELYAVSDTGWLYRYSLDLEPVFD